MFPRFRDVNNFRLKGRESINPQLAFCIHGKTVCPAPKLRARLCPKSIYRATTHYYSCRHRSALTEQMQVKVLNVPSASVSPFRADEVMCQDDSPVDATAAPAADSPGDVSAGRSPNKHVMRLVKLCKSCTALYPLLKEVIVP